MRIDDAPGAGEDVVCLEHVSFRYAGQTEPALRDVTLRVRQGEMVVVMGATGAGKSTLAKCLNRVVPAFQPGELTGNLALFGQPVRHEGVAELAGRVGLVSQDFEAQLFATNVVQEIAFGMEQLGVGAEEMRRRVPNVLQTVGLAGFERRDPATLSGGEKQRLAIAATLALQPRILVFDEPTTDLDPLGKLEIFAVLAAMRRQGYTLLVIEHEIAAADDADRLVVMSEGRIVADDAPRQVLARVDFLSQHGVRAPDLQRLAARLELMPRPCSLDGAERMLRGLGAGGRGSEGESRAPGLTPSPRSLPPLLVADRIQFSYADGAWVLDDVSVTIDVGEFVAIIGQNGSGKTTLAKHLNGLLTPTAGSIRLRGMDIRGVPINAVAMDVGYVFQNPDHQIFAGTVFDEVAFGPQNMSLPPADVGERVQGALQAVGLGGLEDEDPFLLGKGQRQRLAVASLLALRPRVLILDEPTTGLDFAEQRQMMDLLRGLHARGMAIVIITHTPWVVAEYAQRGVLMAGGRVLVDAPLRQLFEQETLLAEAHFCAPDVTRLGRRFGFTPLSVEEFCQWMDAGGWARATGQRPRAATDD